MSRFTLSGADKAERLAYRAAFIPKDARLVPGPSGCAVYAYQTATVFYAMAFRGTAGKPEFHHSYRTAAQRQQHIDAFFESVKQSKAYRAAQAAKKAAWLNSYKVGDIFATCWGYDQTNVDFYVATRVSARCVWVRPIAADYESTGFMSGKTWPKIPIEMHGAETKHVASEGGLNINGHHASLETGRDHYTSSYA